MVLNPGGNLALLWDTCGKENSEHSTATFEYEASNCLNLGMDKPRASVELTPCPAGKISKGRRYAEGFGKKEFKINWQSSLNGKR